MMTNYILLKKSPDPKMPKRFFYYSAKAQHASVTLMNVFGRNPVYKQITR